jgi:polysaccharide pyruvyl transferase WcaK-like protein
MKNEPVEKISIESTSEQKPIRVGVLGASFDTGNMGVSALAESCVKCVLHRWPNAEIVFVRGGRYWGIDTLTVSGRTLRITKIPIRFCSNIFIGSHFLILSVLSMLHRLFPFGWVRHAMGKINRAHSQLANIDIFCDITGGDSFSDIYGMKRFVLGFLTKWLVVLTSKPFLMLPQTYGPFRSRITRLMARTILMRAAFVYSRDKEGLDELRRLMDGRKMCAEPRLCPDVAFVLDAIRPENEQVKQIEKLKAEHCQLIGLNISGLLYNGGYTGNNEFGLRGDYKLLVQNILSAFAKQKNYFVLLVPHVIPKDFEVENDSSACQELWQALSPTKQKKVIVLDDKYDQNETKYLIGLCDFFIGSRMHSTIAALSQCVPAVGLAYSKKFTGVFQTVGVEEYVVDMWQMDESQMLGRIQELYQTRESARDQLAEIIPQVKKDVMSLFDAF